MRNKGGGGGGSLVLQVQDVCLEALAMVAMRASIAWFLSHACLDCVVSGLVDLFTYP